MDTISENSIIAPNKEGTLSYDTVVIQFELKLMLTELLMHFGDCTFFLTITNVHVAAVTWDFEEHQLYRLTEDSILRGQQSICQY